MSLEIHGLDLRLAKKMLFTGVNLRLAKKMLFTGVNLRIDKPNLVVYVIDEAGLFVEGADVNILSSGHNLNSVTDALGTALTRFMPAINNTLTVSKDGHATSSQIIYNETPSTLSVYVQLFASEIRLKVVNNQNEPIEGATCRVLNAISGSNNVPYFDGVNDRIMIPASAALDLQRLTIEGWVYSDTFNRNMFIFEKTTNGNVNTQYSLFFETTNFICFRTYNSAGTGHTTTLANSQNFLTINAWNHVAAVYDGATKKIYVNGVERISQAYNQVLRTNPLGTSIIGAFGSGTGYFFKGNIADVRVWGVGRTLQQLNDNMAVRLNGDEAGLAGYWKLDEGTGTAATDSAGSNNGTIFGATWAEVDKSFPLFDNSIHGYDPTPYDSQTTNANGLTTLNYQINTIHGLEVTLPGKRRFIMPFERTTRGLLDWQVMLSDYLATFATDRGNILINSEPENNDSNFLIE